ncbi:unnamed protein product [Caenorhabditis bovis]|uniref:SXP/RAL-2 family protein Ani s 5-like cation-binding domain-containing protein n=1 Tax=Caenorhabditis bovis TaxID=2654633 RepID=A0A8S1FCK4_9PELO|nr:unnamed protein product [Caenorhabditis bovis]
MKFLIALVFLQFIAAQEVAVEKINSVLEHLSDSKKYIPEYIYNTLQDMNQETRAQIAQLVNDVHEKKFGPPRNMEDMLATLNKEYPLVAQVANQLNTFYRQRLGNLGPKAQEFFNRYEAHTFETLGDDASEIEANIANHAEQLANDFKELYEDPEEAAKLDEQFPEFRNIYNELVNENH